MIQSSSSLHAAPVIVPAFPAASATSLSGQPPLAADTQPTPGTEPEGAPDATGVQHYAESPFEQGELNFEDALMLKQAKQSVLQELQTFAKTNPEAFDASMRQILGDKLSSQQLSALRQKAENGEFPLPQNIRFVSDETLQGNKAAYSPENGGTVYLSESLKENRAALAYALSEEIGHHLDAQAGGPDTPGDEGQIFAQALHQKGPLSAEDLEMARRDNDKGVIRVDGKEVEVEFIAPAIVAAAWWGAQVAGATAIDAALDMAIAAVSGMPPPGPGTHVLNAIGNAIPWLGAARKAKKFAKLGKAIETAISALGDLRKVPCGEQMAQRIQNLYTTAHQAFKNKDFGKVQALSAQILNELGDAQKLAAGIKNGAVKVIGKASAPAAQFAERQLQKKYASHAADFGLTGNFNPANRRLFEQKMREHISKDSTLVMEGTYMRGASPQKVINYYDPQTQLNVMTDMSGNFISGWKLSDKQREYILTTGKLGGG